MSNISPDYAYYKITGADVITEMDQFYADRLSAFDKIKEFGETKGAQNFFYGSFVSGYAFPRGEIPEGWVRNRYVRDNDAYRPGLKNKKCSEDLKIFKELPLIPNSGVLAEILQTSSQRIVRGRYIRSPICDKHGDLHVVGIPIDDDGKHEPPKEGCELMKMSEYWALIEEYGDE
ncbi:hypothetical protein [Kiloniella sp.]|uniref:hypothetical protein n=1 Tax=Kiloniella sp. TaxID=1938587 RepID=UPI003B011767